MFFVDRAGLQNPIDEIALSSGMHRNSRVDRSYLGAVYIRMFDSTYKSLNTIPRTICIKKGLGFQLSFGHQSTHFKKTAICMQNRTCMTAPYSADVFEAFFRLPWLHPLAKGCLPHAHSGNRKLRIYMNHILVVLRCVSNWLFLFVRDLEKKGYQMAKQKNSKYHCHMCVCVWSYIFGIDGTATKFVSGLLALNPLTSHSI
jgi:hypothetical protein